MKIAATGPHFTKTAPGAGPCPAEHRLEEIAEISAARSSETGIAKAAATPPGRWLKISAIVITILAEIVVFLALLRVLQHLVGFAEFLELVFGILFLADIRMEFTRKNPIGLFDFIGRCRLV